MPKLELKEAFLWEQNSHHSTKQNNIVLAHVRRLKFCSGKGSWGSAATHARTQSILQDVSAYPSVEPFLLRGRVCLDIKRRAFLRFRNVPSALVRPEERVKVDPVILLDDCLKRSHRDGRTKFCVVVATGIAASSSGHGLPHGRLNMKNNDIPWRVMLQENRYLNRWTPYVHGVAEWNGMRPVVVDSPFPHGRSDWRPPGSRHYLKDSASLSKFLTFCPLLLELLEDKSSDWQ